ncbi:hypothetical protein [Myxococcus xanthus]|nr:hypothetical protein [Myxococcus xanthus]
MHRIAQWVLDEGKGIPEVARELDLTNEEKRALVTQLQSMTGATHH